MGGPEYSRVLTLSLTLRSVFVVAKVLSNTKLWNYQDSTPIYLYRINGSLERHPTKPTLPIHSNQFLNKTGVCFRPSLGLVASNWTWIGNGGEAENSARKGWRREGMNMKTHKQPPWAFGIDR
jgi:hypothetical protein